MRSLPRPCVASPPELDQASDGSSFAGVLGGLHRLVIRAPGRHSALEADSLAVVGGDLLGDFGASVSVLAGDDHGLRGVDSLERLLELFRGAVPGAGDMAADPGLVLADVDG